MVDALKRLSEVIRTDANYTGRADFLATHCPFQNLEFVKTGSEREAAKVYDEETLFQKELLERSAQHHFIVVQGDNGTGKSHFIRWLKEKYANSVDEEKEAVLLISRSQSTLRGALEQIIHANIFPKSFNTDELKKLVQANEHLSDSALKKNIILQFAALASEDEVQQDPNNPLDKRYRKLVYDFLVDSTVQEFLFRENGPIVRIQERLNPSDQKRRKDDVEPKFFAEDFNFDFSLLQKVKKGGSRNAQRMCESLIDTHKGAQIREQLAKFLNQNREIVIQNCTNLRATDLKQIFETLRKELKQVGKNLALFIEDITSFTGIDRALVEVLVTQHTGNEYSEEFCRLISCVGVTNDYYATSFPDNLKDRVTSRILIDNATLIDDDEIVQMAARYLNAIHLDEEVIQKWADETQALEEVLPIAEENLKYDWALYQLPDGRELSLFPFNRRALLKMYRKLKTKTPRAFLRGVIMHVLQMYLQDEKFPPGTKELEGEFSIETWLEPFHGIIVSQQADGFSDNVSSLLLLWGDRTVYQREEAGHVTIGGLKDEVFKAFKLTPIKGLAETVEGTQGMRSETLKQSTVKASELEHKSQTTSKQSESVSREVEASKVPTLSKNEIKFNELQAELEDWGKGGKLRNYAQLRDDVSKILLDYIDWHSEGIPFQLVEAVLNNKRRVSIEGQIGQINEGFQVLRNDASKYALLALAAWRNLGSKSWDFPDSAEYLLYLYSWLENVKEEVVQSVVQPRHYQKCKVWDLPRWALLAEFYLQVYAGNLSTKDSSLKNIYLKIFQSDLPKIEVQDDRSDEWGKIQKLLSKRQERGALVEPHNLAMRHFNCVQGWEPNTDVFFMNVVPIMNLLKDLKDSNWRLDCFDLEEIESDEIWNASRSILQLLRDHSVEQSVQAEKEKGQEKLAQLAKIIGTDYSKEDIKQLFMEMKSFLTDTLHSANENYRSEDFTILSRLPFAHFIETQNDLDKAVNTTDLPANLLHFSEHPLEKFQPYLDLLEKFDQLVDNKHQRYLEKSNSAEINEIEDIIQETVTFLEGLKDQLEEITKEV